MAIHSHEQFAAPRKRTCLHEVIEIVANLPGITRAEVIDLMPHEPKINIDRNLSYLTKNGRITRSAERPFKHYPPAHGVELPAPKVVPIASARIRELEATVADLQAWKAMALARFPDLAVEPIILQARRIAAEAAPEHADQIAKGLKDSSPIIRAVVMALAEVAA